VQEAAGLARGTYGNQKFVAHAISDMTAPDRAGDGGVRTIRLRIPAKPEYITLCRLALTGLAQLRPIGDDAMADLKLALTEAVSNSVRHAYGPAGDGHVDVRFELTAERLFVEILDDGEGFDPDEAPSFDGDDLSEGGLGIQIIRTIADDLEIESAPGQRGSRLRFVKRL
jgi:serine/threonine-protein kinase RsbW